MLPYYQLDSDFITTKAVMIAASLRIHRHRAVGMGVDLIAYAVQATSTRDKAPDGVLLDPDAPAILEMAMSWDGEPGKAFEAFVRAGVIQKLEVGARVKGTDRYKRTWEKNNRPGPKSRAKSGEDPAQTRHKPGAEPAREMEIVDRDTPSSSKKEEKAPQAPTLPLPQMPEDRFASGGAFFAWVQHERHAAGYGVERAPPPVSLGAWFSEALGELEGDTGRLEATLKGFVRDKYWLAKNLPFQAFMKKWRDYVPRRIAS